LALLLKHTAFDKEAGCDEAGRGCLAGPVVAAAVILPNDFYHPLLNDSKQVSEKNRNILRHYIEETAIVWAIGVCSPLEIDEINILNASILAMHKALDGLSTKPEYLLIDGNRFKPYNNIPYSTMVKGDARFTAIAAASILAKTHRDEMMQNLHMHFPQYCWNRNMGYPTKAHRKGIAQFGPCEWHRKSFKLLKEQLELFG
jgi:ribonuclease HII